MINYVYDIYYRLLPDLKPSTLLTVLGDEQGRYQYAFVNQENNSVSFAKSPGISYLDLLLKSINEERFVYSEKIADNSYYLLVVFSGEVLWADLQDQNSLIGMISLYAHREVGVAVFLLNCSEIMEFVIEGIEKHKAKLKVLQDFPFTTAAANKFALRKLDRVKQELSSVKRKKYLHYLLFFLVVIGGSYFYRIHSIERKAEKLAQKSFELLQKHEDWQIYKSILKKPSPYDQLRNVFRTVEILIFTHPDTNLQNIIYKNNSLQAFLNGNSVPNFVEIKEWAKGNGYNFQSTNSNQIILTKGLFTKTSREYSGTIMSIDSVYYRLIDLTRILGGSCQIQKGTTREYNSFRALGVTFSFQAVPAELVENFFSLLRVYPLELISLQGNLSLGEFSGEIIFHIVGD